MKGHHKVKVFHFNSNDEVDLPEGWKPFAAKVLRNGYTVLVCRKWVRSDV